MYKSQTWYWSCSLQTAEHIFMFVWREVLLLSHGAPFAKFSAAPAKVHPAFKCRYMASSSLTLNSSPWNVHRHLLITATHLAHQGPLLLAWVAKEPCPFLGQQPIQQKVGCNSQKPALGRGKCKGKKCFSYGSECWWLPSFSWYMEYGICLSQNKKWRKQHFDQKAFFFQRAIQNYFRVPMVHVDTAITRDISNPNWRECKSISPEEDLPGHFWVPWVTARY